MTDNRMKAFIDNHWERHTNENKTQSLAISKFHPTNLGTWLELTESLPIDFLKLQLRALVFAVAHLHSIGVSHCSLSMTRVLLDKKLLPVLSQFANAHVESAQLGYPTRFKLPHAPPEVYKHQPSEIARPKQIDSWCLGVIIYNAMYARTPYNKLNSKDKEIDVNDLDFTIPYDYMRKREWDNSDYAELRSLLIKLLHP
jgi:serine/threonine protein kinase